MRPRVPLSNTQRTPMGQTHMHKATSGLGFGFNAHQSSRQTPRAWVGHLQYNAPRKGSSLPPPPHHRTAAPSSSAARSPWPRPPFALCCACVSCCGSVSKGQNTRAQRNKRHTQQFAVFIFKKQPHKRNKRTQSAKSRTAALLLCLVPPSPSLLPRATPCDRPRHPSQRLATRRQSWGQTSV